MDDDRRDDVEADGEQLTRTASGDADAAAESESDGDATTADGDAAVEDGDAAADDDDAAVADADAVVEGGDAAADDATAADALGDAAPRSLEDSAESFVELEAELDTDDAPPDRARVVGAETVPADEVPASYPRRVETGQALALGLAVAGTDETTTAYFEWPPADDSAPLSRLLAALDIAPDSFANLNGRQLLVEVDAGHVVPIVPPTGPAGSEHGLAGILGGHAAMLGLLGAALAGMVSLPTLLLGVVALWGLVVPIATFLDARHLRATTDWDQGPLFWSILQAFPGVNLLVTAAYLLVRRGARALDRS